MLKISFAIKASLCGLILLQVSCGSTGIKVLNNTVWSPLLSDNAKTAIRINPEFNYIGPLHYKTATTSTSGRTHHYQFHSYVFIKTEEKLVKKGISVELEKIDSFYRKDLYAHVPYRLKSGKIDLGGQTYQYIITLIHPKPDNYITIHLVEHKNIKPPACGLGFIASRVYGEKRNRLIGLRYFEDITRSGIKCSAWEDPNHLTPAQWRYLKQFRERFLSAFEFTPTQ